MIALRASVAWMLVAACGGGSARREADPEPSRAGVVWDRATGAAGTVVDTALRRPNATRTPPPEGARGSDWIYCDGALAPGVDPAGENAAAAPVVAEAAHARSDFQAIVVPGYTPLDQAEPLVTIDPIAVERLRLAKADLDHGRAPLVVVSGGNVHPPNTPVNEAMQMKEWLIAEGVPERRIVIEPCARHSHTNLRNAGRFLVANGLSRALVVTSLDQATYFSRPRSSSFDGRCLADLGYLVGELVTVDANRVRFVPSGRVMERGPDPLDP